MMDRQQNRGAAEREVWNRSVQRYLRTLQIHEHPFANEIAESLAVFCQQQNRLSSQSLSLLAARSFCAAGDEKTADRILHGDRRHRLFASVWLDTLSPGCPFSELYPLFSSRVLRPQTLQSSGTLWVLDFNRIHFPDEAKHEILLCQTARILAERTCCLWGKTGGAGTLGLKGLFTLAETFRLKNIPHEIRDHLNAVLKHSARLRNWPHTPETLLLGS